MRRFIVMFLIVVPLVAAAVVAWRWYDLVERRNAVDAVQQRPAPNTIRTTVEIGGPFELTTHTGETATEATFRGKFMLVFFGYTYCPDVCPTNLQTMGQVMDLLGEKATAVQPIFITVDPARDTAAVLSEYLAHFHPRIIGLTGTIDQIKAAAKVYRAGFFKVYFPPTGNPSEQHKEKPAGSDEGDYLINHTAFVYLMGPDGKHRIIFQHQLSPDEMAKAISTQIDREGRPTGG